MVVGIAAACAAAMVKADGNGAVFALGVGMQKVKMLMHKVMSDAKVQDCGSLELTPHKLSLSLVALAKDPSVMAFAAKLRVSCPFHKLFMEAQEALFKGCVGATPLSQGTKMPIARVMSMTDQKWFECDLDINYFWDNIGFKNVDFNNLCASPDGAVNFTKAKLPEHPYNCWAESLRE